MQNQVPPMSQMETGQVSASTDRLIREWLFRFGLNFGKDVVLLLPLWREQFGGIEPIILERLFENALRTCKFFPTIADICGQIDKADAAGLELEAAGAWDRYLTHVKKYFHPDIGWNRRAPQLDAIIEHAAVAAGAAHWIEGCPESELQWARRRFIEAFVLVHRTGQVENLLTPGEAKNILQRLTAKAHAKQIGASPRSERLLRPSNPETSPSEGGKNE
jgi:hypothetical protein